jgi:hypothetical protein
MPIEEATVKAQQSEVAVGTTSAEEGVKKVKGGKHSRQTPGRHVQKGEKISPLTPLPVTELPPDFDFIASKTEDEKIEYIKSLLARSEDEAIAVIAPALQFCGTAGSVVEAYLPLILEVKKHLCRPGRPKVDPATGGRSKTWEEVCKEHFHMSIRRMQQILASLKEPKLLGNGGTPNRRPPIDREDYERARQVAAPARTLAEAVARQGLGGRFPEALEILKLANIPVPDVQPAAIRNGVNKEPDWKGILTGLVTTLDQYGEKLPIPVIRVMKATQELLDGKARSQVSEKSGASTKPYRVQKKRGVGDSTYFAVVPADHRGSWGTFELESEAEAACESLNASPVAVLNKADLNPPKRLCGDHVTTTRSGSAEQFPEAHGPCPAVGEGAQKKRLHNRATSEDSVAPGSVKPGVEEGGGIPSKVLPHDQLEQTMAKVQAATPAAPQEAGPRGMADWDAPQPAAAPMTDVSAREAPTVSLVESRPVPGMGEASQNRNAQPGDQQTPRRKPMATPAKSYWVKPRTKPGFKTDYLIVCGGDKQPYDVFDTEGEAKRRPARG